MWNLTPLILNNLMGKIDSQSVHFAIRPTFLEPNPDEFRGLGVSGSKNVSILHTRRSLTPSIPTSIRTYIRMSIRNDVEVPKKILAYARMTAQRAIRIELPNSGRRYEVSHEAYRGLLLSPQYGNTALSNSDQWYR